jgi:hypothetical protein
LRDLDPIAVAGEVAQLVAEHVARLLFHVDPTAAWHCPSGAGSSLGFSTALLVEWAKRGTNGEQWTAGHAMDAIQSVCEALYSRAGEPGTFGGGAIDLDDADPDDAIGVVLLAAHARVRLAHGGDVPAAELAVLASMSPVNLRLLVRSGELQAVEGKPVRVSAEVARRWLAARGIAGVAGVG